MGKTIRVIFDSNIWISFAIGKRLNELKMTFTHPKVKIFVCQKLLQEVTQTIQKPKLIKYISSERREMLLEILKVCHCINIIDEQAFESRDSNDNFLLDLAATINANFLITGDNDLLILNKYQNTNIITFNSFMAFFETISS